MALRTSFEVLFDESETEPLREAVSELLDSDDAAKSPRTWTTRRGRERTVEMTDLEWWFTSFSELRNAIAHGDPIPEERYRFEDHWHFWIAESRLREAIKETVAEAGYPDIRLEYSARILKQAFDRADAEHS